MSEKRPGRFRMLGRGAVCRCPWCGTRARFRGLLAIEPRCRSCGLIFQPDPSDFLAAATLSYGVAAILWILFLIVYLILNVEDGIDAKSLTITSVSLVTVVGIIGLRPAKTTWSAFDLILCNAHNGLEVEDAERFGLPVADLPHGEG